MSRSKHSDGNWDDLSGKGKTVNYRGEESESSKNRRSDSRTSDIGSNNSIAGKMTSNRKKKKRDLDKITSQ